ncbi:MAG: methyltransferase family protein [Jiangellaceae bacterium]
MARTIPDTDRYGWALVAAQIGCGVVVAWPGPRRWPVPSVLRRLGWVVAGAGSAAAAVAAAELGPHVSPLPKPAESALLRRDGLYRYVRHPIYAGLLATAAGVAMARGRPEPVAAAACLAGVLTIKADYEEKLLQARFGADYDDYMARTPRFMPRSSVLRRSGA